VSQVAADRRGQPLDAEDFHDAGHLGRPGLVKPMVRTINSGLAFRGIDAAASLKRQGIRN
jgi:hypothetical protein